jgi:hypothetical protein
MVSGEALALRVNVWLRHSDFAVQSAPIHPMGDLVNRGSGGMGDVVP